MKKHFLAEIEEEMLSRWQKDKTFEKSLDQNKDGQLFNFYDGPPFANGMPHYGHIVQTTIKDAVTRYKTMQGFYVPRRVGWDTHGLPVEYAIEKEEGFKGKQDIIKFGIDRFNKKCRDSVFKYRDEWEKMFKRVGRWADYSKTYATLDESYIESVWWAFKSIYEKGLVYKDFRSSPYCPRCATPLSNFELNLGYQDNVEDPSLFVKFKLKDEDAFLLGWTTTPWSLPGNSAIAVNETEDYVYVKLKDDELKEEVLILAKKRLECLNSDDYHILKELKGHELVGKEYEPLFKIKDLDKYEGSQNLYKVWPADFVSIEDGSGVLHVAPAFGEDDLKLGKQNNIPVIITIDESGKVKQGMGLDKDIEGLFFKKADAKIIEILTLKDRVFAAETFKHTYPFCWRCDTPLLYYATDSWQVKVSSLNNKLMSNNDQINWVPGHIKNGRFGKWLENAKDWAISRNRYWGAPLPVWVTDDGEMIVVGSVKELKSMAIDQSKVGDLHRPYIDDVLIKTKSGKIAKRIDEVFDCWFESGSMPFAQDHYPFENKAEWEEKYPAEFIAEAIDQTRGWFYTLHVISTALFDKPAYKNVICSGWVVAADGEKLSKRKKNYAPMDDVFEQFGVDTLRFFMASSPIVNGEDVRFSTDFLRDVQRKIFMTLNNVYSFYKLYSKVDHFKPEATLKEPVSTNLLDNWIISRVNETIKIVTKEMDSYRLDRATRPLSDLLDDTSNWYVRRSRRRFWKSEDDQDKKQAYKTLYYVILKITQLLAPVSPFLSDYIWQDLVKGTDLPASVHLSSWPKASKIDQKLIAEMIKLRENINIGLSIRAENSIKVRQPLGEVEMPSFEYDFDEIILEELNVKKIKKAKKVNLDIKITDELYQEGLIRELIRHIQNARKNANFNVDDRIDLYFEKIEDPNLKKAIDNFKDIVCQETLAVVVDKTSEDALESLVKIEDKEVVFKLSKKSK